MAARRTQKGLKELAQDGGNVAAPVPPITHHPAFRDMGFCFICKASSCGLGFSPSAYAKPKWFCDDCTPAKARRFYAMNKDKINEFESEAMRMACDRAGGILDEMGETDLANLSVEQYHRFGRELLTAYISAMRQLTAYMLPEEGT